ncbi:rod shape-determining protein [bacterium]|nr:rod shape-determining protein [bacterium]
MDRHQLGSWLKKFCEYNLGVDLGSVEVKIFVEGKGVLFSEPAVVARKKKREGGEVLAVGKKARLMIGKNPHQIEIVFPIQRGVVADFDTALILTNYLFGLVKQTPGKWWKILGPKVVVGVSLKATEVERRAVKALMVKNGAREVFLVEKPLAAALGAGLPIESRKGSLVVDIGGETTEMAVISLGGIVLDRYLPFGKRDFALSLINYLRLKEGVIIGKLTAEEAIDQLAVVSPREQAERKQMVVRGQALESGLPKSVRVSQSEVMEAIAPLVLKIIAALEEMLEEAPTEMTEDIAKKGIVITGGGATIPGWERLIKEETKIFSQVVKSPHEAVVRGCGYLLTDFSLLKKIKLATG